MSRSKRNPRRKFFGSAKADDFIHALFETQKQIESIHQETKQKIKEETKTYEKQAERTQKEYIQQQKETITKLDQQQKPHQTQKALESELKQTQEQLETTENTHQKEQTQAKINQITQQLQEIKQNPLTSAVDIDALETKTPSSESKQTFAQIRQQIHQEAQNFDLTLKEKENILRLLITNLNLTSEQRNALEDIGQELANLSPERLKTFAFAEPQKTILQSLAPLTKEFKHSPQSLALIRSLGLKATNLSFLVQEEIIPDPNTQFGETKSPYLPLKLKFLQGEQKALEQEAKARQKETDQEEIAENKRSILKRLMVDKEISSSPLALKPYPIRGRPPNLPPRPARPSLHHQPSHLRQIQALNSSSEEELRKQFTEYQKTKQIKPETTKSSRYDNLFSNLNQETAEHQRKKQAREATRKKLEQTKLARRQQQLHEKDRKIQEEEENRQRERELDAQEAEKRRQLQTARDRELMEQEQARLQARTEQIEPLEAQNKLEQERLQKQAQLLEEETKKQEIDRRRRQSMMSLELIHEQALDYVLGYFPSESEFAYSIQTSAPWGYNYAMDTFYTGRQLSRVISYVGGGFLSEEQLRQRIKEKINDPDIFR
ncbi:1608_t:CDS:10 [Entrophospora sp. SA101]|nr:1608_t:CDS:10 [Entrophospora sp. SA101]